MEIWDLSLEILFFWIIVIFTVITMCYLIFYYIINEPKEKFNKVLNQL